MNKKRLLTYLATLTILVSLVSPLFFVSNAVQATEPDSYYKLIPGVLNTDGYLLYPFETDKNLTIGFSKFGELIDSKNNVGLEYGAVDPFAPPAGKSIYSIAKSAWVQGWYINITYYHKVKAKWRCVWAGALHSDGTNYANGSWIRVDFTGDYGPAPYLAESFEDPGAFIGNYAWGFGNNGGRKTNGTCVTKDIQILYNGSRRLIALLNTTIYDHFDYRTDMAPTNPLWPGEDIPLLDVVVTIVFDKVKKSVVLLKDIKTKVSSKYATEMKVQFSNRGEVDLGTEAAGYDSYFHFYTEGISAVQAGKNVEWTVTPAHPPPYDTAHEGLSTVYNWDYVLNQTEEPNWPSSYTGHYKNYTTCGPNPNATGLFDLATAINPTAGYYWYAAFWPILSDWSIDGWGEKYRSMMTFDPHYIDAGGPSLWDEPDIPFYIGEWDFLLHPRVIAPTAKNQQFRFVTVYGVNKLHTGSTVYYWPPHNIPVGGGDDVGPAPVRPGHINRIDREAAFQLNEVFNPYDLYGGVHKQEYRWLDKRHLTSATNYITLTNGLDDGIYTLIKSNTTFTAEWVNELEDSIDAHSKNWAALLQVNCTYDQFGHADLRIVPPGAGTTLKFQDLVDLDFWYYLYSSPTPTYGPHICVYLSKTGGRKANEKADITMMTNTKTTTGTWLHVTIPTIADYVMGGDADKSFHIFYDIAADWNSETQGPLNCHSLEYWQGLTTASRNYIVDYIQVELGWWNSGWAKALIDDVSIGYLNRPSGIRYQRVYNLEEDKLVPTVWDKYCSFAERVLVEGTLIRRYGYRLTSTESYYTIDFETGTIRFYLYTGASWTLPICSDIKVLYSTIEENEKGQYEWGVVGSTSAAVDSAGLAMVSAAFKNKDIEYENSGLDCQDTIFGPRVPYMLAKKGYYGLYPAQGYGKHPDKAYYDNIGRLYIRDDFCNHTAISSSNIIMTGSPMANLLAEYFNEFTDAFIYSKLGDGIMSVACWRRTLDAGTFVYPGGTINDQYGYAVVSIYKDINGTIGFLFYGWTGQDTYFACRWFNVRGFYNMAGTWVNLNGAEYLQTENRGVTTLILRITYKDADGLEVCPPTVQIVERLGTVTEKTPHDP